MTVGVGVREGVLVLVGVNVEHGAGVPLLQRSVQVVQPRE